MKKVLLAALIILIMVTGAVLTLSVVPNPLIKTKPWVAVEWISLFEEYTSTGTLSVFLLGVSIHNPTHHAYRVELTNVELSADLTLSSGDNQRLKPSVLRVGLPEIYWHGIWKYFDTIEMQACLPDLISFSFVSLEDVLVSQVDKGTFHLNLTGTIDGDKTLFSNDFSTDFVETSMQTTTTSITSTTTYKAANECLFPWV